MSTKNIMMGYCFLYALARFAATTIEYFSGSSELQLATMIIAETVSLIGLVISGFWFAGKVSSGVVRSLLALNSVAAIVNIVITRSSPINAGASALDLLVIGTVFDLVLFVAALLMPMPEVAPKRHRKVSA